MSVGSKVMMNGIYRVTAVDATNNLIAISQLTGQPTASYHWFDPTPFYIVDSTGCLAQGQSCYVGCYVKLDSVLTVSGLNQSDEGWACKVTIGNRTNWVWTEYCTEI